MEGSGLPRLCFSSLGRVWVRVSVLLCVALRWFRGQVQVLQQLYARPTYLIQSSPCPALAGPPPPLTFPRSHCDATRLSPLWRQCVSSLARYPGWPALNRVIVVSSKKRDGGNKEVCEAIKIVSPHCIDMDWKDTPRHFATGQLTRIIAEPELELHERLNVPSFVHRTGLSSPSNTESFCCYPLCACAFACGLNPCQEQAATAYATIQASNDL